MADALADLKHEIARGGERLKLLEGILVSAITEETAEFPTEPQYILSELVNGAADYAAAVVAHVNYRDLRFSFTRRFEDEAEKTLKTILETRQDRFPGEIGQLLGELARWGWNRDLMGDADASAKLYEYIRHSEIRTRTHRPTFSLAYDFVRRIEKDILPEYSTEEREAIAGIGRAMRPHIDADIAFIEKRYRY